MIKSIAGSIAFGRDLSLEDISGSAEAIMEIAMELENDFFTTSPLQQERRSP